MSIVKVEKSNEERKRVCKNCYACETGVSPEVTVDTLRGKKVPSRLAECKNCYTCQDGVSSEVNIDNCSQKSNSQGKQFTWFVFPTNGCNLRCTYCYANNSPGIMTEETKHDVLSWLFSKQPHKKINVHFFGGEPMVNWPVLRSLVSIGNVMAKNAGIEVVWSMTTNGTLLDVEAINWIEENFRSDNPFLLSIDGRQATHDRHRIYANGTGSFDKIPIDLILCRFPNIEIRPTIEPDTAEDWFEDYRWLRNTGFRNIAIEPNYETEWTEEQISGYEAMLEKLGDYYYVAQLAGNPIRMKWIDGILSSLKNGKAPDGRMCGVAFNCGAIDHRGNLFACQRYASYNDPETYSIGHVTKGFDEYKLYTTQSLTRDKVHGRTDLGYDCETCVARFVCHKGCNAANRKWNGKREVSVGNYCRLMQIDVKVALGVLARLGVLRASSSSGGACSCK